MTVLSAPCSLAHSPVAVGSRLYNNYSVYLFFIDLLSDSETVECTPARHCSALCVRGRTQHSGDVAASRAAVRAERLGTSTQNDANLFLSKHALFSNIN